MTKFLIRLFIVFCWLTCTAQAASESIVLGMGCFWGAEKRMGELPGVLDVETGYANGDIAGDYQKILAH